MNLVGKLLVVAFASVIIFGLRTLFKFVYHQMTSPIRCLRGPKATSWIYGNLPDFVNTDVSGFPEEWLNQYGHTLRFNGFFTSNQLLTVDIRAVSHILAHSSDYQKPPVVRSVLSRSIDNSVVVVEGPQHHKLRRIMNPAFGLARIRELTNTFLEKAHQLCDVFSSEIAKDPTGTTCGARIDVMEWLSRTTLDIIGLAGFDHDFNLLTRNKKSNELPVDIAFTSMIEAAQSPNTFGLLQLQIPLLRIIPNHGAQRFRASRRVMSCFGKELLSSANAAARASATEKGEIKRKDIHGRDLFSLLIKANIATDVSENQRLSDEDVLAQIPTILVAGHETMSAAITWVFYAISKAPEVQVKLREELLSVDTETPSMEELSGLPYLDAVVRESLRLHPPVPVTLRIATKDDVIPVEKPYIDRNGAIHHSISIIEGDMVVIPMFAINLSQELWGDDAREFKPERWKNIPEAVANIPGVWSHLMTFLGGSRACIAHQFSVVEMKAILFALVRAFEFDLAVPISEIGGCTRIIARPVLRSDPRRKPQLPMLVKPYQHT